MLSERNHAKPVPMHRVTLPQTINMKTMIEVWSCNFLRAGFFDGAVLFFLFFGAAKAGSFQVID